MSDPTSLLLQNHQVWCKTRTEQKGREMKKTCPFLVLSPNRVEFSAEKKNISTNLDEMRIPSYVRRKRRYVNRPIFDRSQKRPASIARAGR